MEKFTLVDEGYAIPFTEIKRLIQFYPYGHPKRVAFEFVAQTGCRLVELDEVGTNSILGNVAIWKARKNQTGYRREKLENWFLDEINYMLKHHPHCGDRLFSFSGKHLRQALNKKIRPQLGGLWLVKKFMPKQRGAIRLEYMFQLKGLRHTFATLDFYNNFLKWGAHMAIEMTAKRMKHSSYKMTAQHYIDNFDRLDIKRYAGLRISDIIRTEAQARIPEYT